MKIKLFSGIAAVIFAIAFTACGSGGSGSNSTENVYTITFDANNGSGGPTPVQVVDGDPLPNISLQTPPERAGYYFIGYFDSPVGGTMYYTDALTPAKSTWDKKYDTTLYAQWSLTPKVTIIFHKNDGSGETTTQSVEVNKATALSANTFSREGYAFKGWSTTQTGSVEYTDGANYKAGASSIDLYAIWTAKQYTITFDANGGSGGPASADIIYGESMPALIASAPTHTEYYFAGYYDAKTGGTMYYTAEMQSARTWDRTSATTLYARWTAIPEVTIIFNSNYGSNQTETQNVRENTSISLRENTFTRDGYKFEGWATSTSGIVEYANEASYTVGVSTVNLYAVWSARQYNVSFDPNGGSGGPTSVGVTYGEAMPALIASAPTQTGYYFSGYFNTTSGGVMYYTAEMQSARIWDRTSAITLYAQWTAIPKVTIIFNSNYGSNQTETQNVFEKTSIHLRANTFTRGGYTFQGWSTTSTGSVEYADGVSYSVGAGPSSVNLYAVWTCTIHIPNSETGLCTICGELTYAIGELGPGGGFIFYRSQTGFTRAGITGIVHYLEVATESLGLMDWSPANTACNNYVNNGKDDWFLPSADDLMGLHFQIGNINTMKTYYTYCWSSTRNGSLYRAIRLVDGDIYDSIPTLSRDALPVRAF